MARRGSGGWHCQLVPQPVGEQMALTPVRVALDWTANTAHAALLVAEGAGFNAARGLAVTFVEATDPEAPATPLHGVVDGSVTIGVAPCDQVFSEHHGEGRVECVAALIDSDISAICVPEDSPIRRPRDLAGSRYGSCAYPLELACLSSMIEADGGSGSVVEVQPPERPETETLLMHGDVDSVWMYRPWEVLRAKLAGVSLRQFRPAECGVPFGYMNTLVVRKTFVAEPAGRDLVQRLLAAAAEGAAWAQEDPARAGALLASMAGTKGVGADAGLTDAAFNTESIEALVELQALAPAGERRWGEMDPERWDAFVAWAVAQPAGREMMNGGGGGEGAVSLMYTNDYARAGPNL